MGVLSAEHQQVIDATVGVVAANIEKITATFYPRMFKNNPEVLNFFNMSNQREKRQPQALANAVVAAVGHLDNLPAIMPALKIMGYKHCALGVLPEHYSIVHDNFLGAVAEVLGDAVTPEVAAAWSAVLMAVAKALIGLEETLYEEAASRPGGWRGVKAFTVTRTAVEDRGSGATSLYLSPADGGAAPEFSPGQYVTVCDNPTAAERFAPRHYTISSARELRITVKPIGEMSRWLCARKEGEIVSLRPPFGPTADLAHVIASELPVLVTGGIGVTPGRVLAEAAAGAGKDFVSIHAGHGDSEHPLCAEIAMLGKESAGKESAAKESEGKESAGDESAKKESGAKGKGSHCVTGGRSAVEAQAILAEVEKAGGDPMTAGYFVSGPVEMMKAVGKGLREAGVPKGNIRWTAFGPALREI